MTPLACRQTRNQSVLNCIPKQLTPIILLSLCCLYGCQQGISTPTVDSSLESGDNRFPDASNDKVDRLPEKLTPSEVTRFPLVVTIFAPRELDRYQHNTVSGWRLTTWLQGVEMDPGEPVDLVMAIRPPSSIGFQRSLRSTLNVTLAKGDINITTTHVVTFVPYPSQHHATKYLAWIDNLFPNSACAKHSALSTIGQYRFDGTVTVSSVLRFQFSHPFRIAERPECSQGHRK